MSRPRPTPRVREKSATAAGTSSNGPARPVPSARSRTSHDAVQEDEESFFTRKSVRPVVISSSSSGESSRSGSDSGTERGGSSEGDDSEDDANGVKRRRRRRKRREESSFAIEQEKGKAKGTERNGEVKVRDDEVRNKGKSREQQAAARRRSRSLSLTPPPELDEEVKKRIKELVDQRTREESRETSDTEDESADKSLPLNLEEWDPDLIRNLRGKRGIELRKRYKELQEKKKRRDGISGSQKDVEDVDGPQRPATSAFEIHVNVHESDEGGRPRKRSKSKSMSQEKDQGSSKRVEERASSAKVQTIVIVDDSGSEAEKHPNGTTAKPQTRARTQATKQRRPMDRSSDSEIEFVSAQQTQASQARLRSQQPPSEGLHSQRMPTHSLASLSPAPTGQDGQRSEFPSSSSSVSAEERITVTLRGGDGGMLKIPVKVKKTTLVSTLRNHFIEIKRDLLTPAQAAKVKLMFDGRVLDGKQTMEDIDVEDDDLIDVDW